MTDPNSWRPTGSLSKPHTHHTATLLPTGKVLVAGGGDFAYDPTTELYDPALGTWSLTGSLNIGRYDATSTLLSNGTVLMTGGIVAVPGAQQAEWQATTELYDPATGTWSLAPSLNTGRSNHTAVLLKNGTVLVNGGYDNDNTEPKLASTELYGPLASPPLAPQVTAPPDQTGYEGTVEAFSLGSFTDAGTGSPWTVDIDWGDGSSHTTFSAATAGALGTQNHAYADNGTYQATVKVANNHGASDSRIFTVAVNNVAPVVTLTQPAAINENDTATLNGSFADPGTLDTHTVLIDWGDAAAKTTLNLAAGILSFNASHQYLDDNPTGTPSDSYPINVTVTDKDGGSGSASSSVTVNNVAPAITSFAGTDSLIGPLAFASSTFITNFTDPGAQDTWTASFTYPDGSPTQQVNSFASGQQITHQFAAAGCNKAVSATVADDDTGSATATTTVNVGTGAFLPPMTNQPVTDKLRNGRVLPVKVRITDCSGNPVTNLTPAIRLVAGDQTSAADDTTDTITPPSVSSADTTGLMRLADGYYIYNLQVNLPALNADYTVIIYPYGTANAGQTLRRKIQATK